MALDIIHGGGLALIQDFGRYGLQRHGVTHGGPLDEHSFLWANKLLDNHYNAAQIEISFGGFSARFCSDTMIALCGADLSATLNDKPLPLWQSVFVNEGDEIRFLSPRSGLRCYLAIKQGFTIPNQLSSCSTVMREKLGVLYQKGEKLTANDRLPYATHAEETSRQVPIEFIPQYVSNKERLTLRFIPNRSPTGCTDHAIDQLTQQEFTITPQSDRMGYRLSGNPINNITHDIISQGISLGAIQLPRDGKPIILMKDRQTMGGYPQLGCVASLDLPLLAQSMPGTKVTFSTVSIGDLEEELISFKRFFDVNL